jgi:hypothetical protein
MSTTFADFLNEVSPDADTIQQSLRIYLSERTGDLTPDEMLSTMLASAADRTGIEQARIQLERSPEAIDQAALVYFEREWDDEEQRPAIRAVFLNAKNQLPVIETAIIAIAAMYAVHMLVTGGVTERITRTRKRSDGTFEWTSQEKVEPFHPIVSAIANLLHKKNAS